MSSSSDSDSDPEYTELREELLAYIYDEEHSDLPVRYFRISSSVLIFKETNHVSIETRTKLGAYIMAIDWIENNGAYISYWTKLLNEYIKYESIDKFVDFLIKRLDNNEQLDINGDRVLVEAKEPVIITFLSGNTKSAGKR